MKKTSTCLLICTIFVLLMSGLSYAVEAPTPFPPKIRHDVELFIDVYDSIFDAKRTKSNRALQLWDALIDHEAYKEINLSRPFEFWDWKQARKRNGDFIDFVHHLLAKGQIPSPRKALWQSSKIDGYRMGSDGVIIYTRFFRTYNHKNHYGFAIFKIKAAETALDIKKWNVPPYASNWKISEMQWSPITLPLYNKPVFDGYPILDW